MGTEAAWLLLAYGEDRAYGGNAGYDDGADHYSYDSNVANWTRVKSGDRVIVAARDGTRGPPLGVGWAKVARVTREPGVKEVGRCPSCGHPRFKARLTKRPRWRCDNGHEFDEPTVFEQPVTELTAWFGGSYKRLSRPLASSVLRHAQIRFGDGNSIRAIDWRLIERHIQAQG